MSPRKLTSDVELEFLGVWEARLPFLLRAAWTPALRPPRSLEEPPLGSGVSWFLRILFGRRQSRPAFRFVRSFGYSSRGASVGARSDGSAQRVTETPQAPPRVSGSVCRWRAPAGAERGCQGSEVKRAAVTFPNCPCAAVRGDRRFGVPWPG